MTSPLFRLQTPPTAGPPLKGFRTLSGNSSEDLHRRSNAQSAGVKSRPGPEPAQTFSSGWRPKRASDRLLSPPLSAESHLHQRDHQRNQERNQERNPERNQESPDSAEDSPQKNIRASDECVLKPVSVRSRDPLSSLRAERHDGSSVTDRKCSGSQDTPTTESVWSDLSDVRDKQREKWRLFKEKKQNRTNASIRTKNQDQTGTRTRTTANSEPIVLSSEEEEAEQYVPTTDQSQRSQVLAKVPSDRPPAPSFLQLDFTSFHMGLSRARANGKVTIMESGITVPLRGEGSELELCVVATQVRGFGLWDGGVAKGGTLFADSSHKHAGSAPSLLFLSVTDAQSKLLQTELREIYPRNQDPVCPLLLLVLKEQLSDLDSALVLSVLDSGDYRESRFGPESGLLDWTEGLVLVHMCPAPLDSHLLRLLGQSRTVRTRNRLRSSAQHMPTRLIQYPAAPSKGRISVTSEDLLCLKHGEFLNDVIIDFYLKYLLMEGVGGAVAERSHVFSSFFYKQLSKRRAAGEDAIATIPDRHTRHQRVKTWTRNVDIFSKDFLFIPVNQECHWFLVLVCFPGLEQSRVEPFSPGSDVIKSGFGLRSQTPPECTQKGCGKTTVLQRPVLLVMDSLKLSHHENVTRLIRDYLWAEWQVQRGSKRLFSSVTLKSFNCRVPQQDNSSDCGLYLLQYAQVFLQNPVVDFEFPVRLETWFPRQQIRDKRNEIRNLVLRLHRDQGLDQD